MSDISIGDRLPGSYLVSVVDADTGRQLQAVGARFEEPADSLPTLLIEVRTAAPSTRRDDLPPPDPEPDPGPFPDDGAKA